jgi:hypothetical protein
MISNSERAFAREYTNFLLKNGILYAESEFLYGHEGPWPQPASDHPYAQAPEVLNVPAAEAADWTRHIGTYYSKIGRKAGTEAAKYAGEMALAAGIQGYSDVDDALFAQLMCEGLFSKFLCELDPIDKVTFAEHLVDQASHQYLKLDFSCMRVIEQPWGQAPSDESAGINPQYVAPTVVLVRRPKPAEPTSDEPNFDWEAVAISVATYERTETGLRWSEKQTPFGLADQESWWLLKLFSLQGAIHRINLIDHTKVHFPSDTINSITKTILPRWHWVHKLLVPHFWLTLPVNNAVLEGDRSIINRETWYPWAPFGASGGEVRKLLGFGWLGDPGNSAFPGYSFALRPESTTDANDPRKVVTTFIGLRASRYALFLEAYHGATLEYTKSLVAFMFDREKRTVTDEAFQLEMLEIRNWAQHIADLLPGFPGGNEILDQVTLAETLAMVIWNAAIVHTADHTLLHQLFEKRVPMPYVLRVPPPQPSPKPVPETSLYYTLLPEYQQKWEKVPRLLGNLSWWKRLLFDGVFAAFDVELKEKKPVHGNVPLCWPSDTGYARMADQLFYLPHNTTTLHNTAYQWIDDRYLKATWPAGRPLIDEATASELNSRVADFKSGLEAIDAQFASKSERWNLPLLKLPRLKGSPSISETTECLGAGIQY